MKDKDKDKKNPTVKTAVILAAGLGSRLAGCYGEKPKGFVPVGGTPLIERSVKILAEAGITSIIIGTGHLHEFYDELAAAASTRFPAATKGGNESSQCSGLLIKCVINPDYASTGSMATLYNLRGHIEGDFLLLESDLLYEQSGIYELLSDERDNLILASGRTGSGDEVFIETGAENRLMNMSKRAADLNKIDAELVGISKVSLSAYRLMCACYEARAAAAPKLDYESVLVSVSNSGTAAGAATTSTNTAAADIFVKKIEDYAWCEIDDKNHLERAVSIVYPEIKTRDAKRERV